MDPNSWGYYANQNQPQSHQYLNQTQQQTSPQYQSRTQTSAQPVARSASVNHDDEQYSHYQQPEQMVQPPIQRPRQPYNPPNRYDTPRTASVGVQSAAET